MFKKIATLSLISLLLSVSASAQLIDYIQVYGGTRIFPQNEQLSELTKLPENFYAGFSAGQVVGATVYRQVLDQLCVGAGFEISNSNKPNYTMNINTINTHAKLNLTNIERFLSPYLIGGVNLSFNSIRQDEFTKGVNPDLSNVNTQGPVAYNIKTTYREPFTNVLFVPVVGAHAGGGLEIKITEGWGIFGQYTLNYQLTNISLLQETYSYNKSNMLYHNIIAGIRFFL